MLHCKACTHHVRLVSPEVLNPYRLSRGSLTSTLIKPFLPSRQRDYTTEAVSLHDVPAPSPSLNAGIRKPHLSPSNRYIKQNKAPVDENLWQEARWLKDPLRLGDHTVRLLRKNSHERALAIVRLLSKDVGCTVSWNHLIDYHMSRRRPSDAVKLYNEMKKRAQLPDAYTFTILFRGLSWYPEYPLAVERAITIYHSMFTDNSPVRPSIIHTNAVLKVCALVGDMDALLGVASRLPAHGPNAPNNLTFTTILNAIRSDAWKSKRDQGDEAERAQMRARAIMQGRRLWEEIKERWAQGDLALDEELVCAVGRLMLLSNNEKDCDDILSLLEQTMGIPRQTPRLGQNGQQRPLRGTRTVDSPRDTHLSSSDTMMPVVLGGSDEAEGVPEPESDPFAPLARGPPKGQTFLPPGRNTLSLVVDACVRIHLDRAAQDYWGLLTDPAGNYRIVPDTENYHMYLRLLRIRRASKLTTELITDMRQGDLGPDIRLETKTFRIALACCVRDKNNRSSITHAGKIVRVMQDTLEHPDARTLTMYIQLTLSQEPRDWRTLMGVLRGTELGIRNLRSLLAYDPEKGEEVSQDVQELVKSCVSGFDVVLDLGDEEMSTADKKMCKEQKATLQAWISRTMKRDRDLMNSQTGRTIMRTKKRIQAGARDDEVAEAHEGTEASLPARSETRRWIARRKKRAELSTASNWERLMEE